MERCVGNTWGIRGWNIDMTKYRGITNPNLELVNEEFLSSEVRVKLEQTIKANLRGLGYGG